MDLTISLANGKITTKVYEKPMALYQYITPSSAHPPGLNVGLVIGQVLRFHQLSSLESDAHHQMKNFYKRLLARGHTKERLLPLFVKGLSKAKKFLALPHQQRLQAQTCKHDCVFLKLPFHPYDPKSSIIQSLWRSIIIKPEEKQPLYDIPNHINEPIGVKRMIVAYSRPHNIGNILSVRRFDRLIRPKVSSYGFHNQGSDR